MGTPAVKMICAALQAPPAYQRKPTRKSSANQRANHFPKDVRYYRNEAQTILAAAQTILPSRANHFAGGASHFALRRKPFIFTSDQEDQVNGSKVGT